MTVSVHVCIHEQILLVQKYRLKNFMQLEFSSMAVLEGRYKTYLFRTSYNNSPFFFFFHFRMFSWILALYNISFIHIFIHIFIHLFIQSCAQLRPKLNSTHLHPSFILVFNNLFSSASFTPHAFIPLLQTSLINWSCRYDIRRYILREDDFPISSK